LEGGGRLKKEYIYAVTSIHGYEKYLLSAQDMERLILAPDANTCFQLLAEKGWEPTDGKANDADALTKGESKKTYALVEELIGDLAPFNVLFCENDFHNLKAAIKLVYLRQGGEDTDKYFVWPTTVEPELILQAARQHDFSALPPAMAEAGLEAHQILSRTGNGQACDMALDYAALLAIDAEGKRSGIDLLQRYASLKVDTANIKAAVRACHMRKGRDFLLRAIAPAGSLDTKALIDAAEKSPDDIYAYLARTEYSGAVEALKDSLTAFEVWCDNLLIESIRPQKHEYFSLEPLAAYILGRRNEIAMVRLILSAKINHLSDAVIRRRWRQMYV
jgi:V/A-type H+-transporting ATPase subunit C